MKTITTFKQLKDLAERNGSVSGYMHRLMPAKYIWNMPARVVHDLLKQRKLKEYVRTSKLRWYEQFRREYDLGFNKWRSNADELVHHVWARDYRKFKHEGIGPSYLLAIRDFAQKNNIPIHKC